MKKLSADFKKRKKFFVIFYEKYLGSENYGGVAKVGQLLTAQVLALRCHNSILYQ